MLNRMTLKGPLGISLLAGAVCLVALLVQVPSLFSAVLSPGVGENRTLAALDEHVKKHDELARLSQERFDGRYLFYPPPPPPPKQAPKPVVVDEEPVEVQPVEEVKPPPITTYGGPKIAYVIGEQVYFKEGEKLSNLQVGESNDHVKVVGISPPWSVRLLWKETEFDVVPIDWMKREYAFFSSTTPTFSAPAGLVMNASKPDGKAGSPRGGARGSESGGDRKAGIASAREKQAAARERAKAAEEPPPPPPDEDEEAPSEEEGQDDQPADEGETEDEAEDEPQRSR